MPSFVLLDQNTTVVLHIEAHIELHIKIILLMEALIQGIAQQHTQVA